MGKTHISELFFRERAIRLPLPWAARFRLAITEHRLRLLITSLIVLFLLVLGSALLIQLIDNRTSHLDEQNRLSSLYGQAAAQRIKADYLSAASSGETPPAMNAGYLDSILAAGALAEQRGERGAGIEIAAALLGVGERHQNLRGNDIPYTEGLGPGMGKCNLANRRRRLALFQLELALRQAEAAPAKRYGTR